MLDFSKMSVADLKSYAEENNLDLGSAKTKTAILSVITGTTSKISESDNSGNNVVGSQKIVKEKRVPVSNSRSNDNGVVSVGSAETFNKEFKKESETPEGKVAIFSEKNMHWNGVGGISKGYNIVTKEAANMWLTRKAVREATPQEVANHYGL